MKKSSVKSLTLEQQIQKFYNTLFEGAASIVQTGEEHRPLIVRVTTLGALELYGLTIPKPLWQPLQRSLLERPDTAFVGLICEAWAVVIEGKHPRLPECAPSEHPDWREVVMFVFTAPTGRTWLAQCLIDRTVKVKLTQAPLESTDRGWKVGGRVLPASEPSHSTH